MEERTNGNWKKEQCSVGPETAKSSAREKDKMRDSNWHYIAGRSSLKKTYFRAHSVPCINLHWCKEKKDVDFSFSELQYKS